MKALRPALCVLAPSVAGFIPPLRDALLYDRAAILHGEWWRLWSGHWMHFSPSHFFWNAVVIAGAGTWLEVRRPGLLGRFLFLAAPLLSVTFLFGAPTMAFYGGLSGLATGVVVLLALAQLARPQARRAWWLGVLALVGLKLGVDAFAPGPLFADFGGQVVRTSVLAHAMGAAAAILFFLSPAGRSPLGVEPVLSTGSRS